LYLENKALANRNWYEIFTLFWFGKLNTEVFPRILDTPYTEKRFLCPGKLFYKLYFVINAILDFQIMGGKTVQ
jgi:hypothetical protein